MNINDLKKLDLERFQNEIIEKYNGIYYKTLDLDWFIFMNDGYMPLDQHGFPLTDNDFPSLLPHHAFWKYQAYLYISLLKLGGISTNTKQGKLLDIGCGRGGGLSVYRDYFNFASLTGLDINQHQIDFCKKTHANINFIKGSAMKLPFDNETFNIITNVESSNYYICYDDFINEVNRTLTPGGLFLYTDAFFNDRVSEVISQFTNNGFELVVASDITTNVRSACAINKYNMLSKSRLVADIMMWDEERYYADRRNDFVQPDASYNILIFKKLNVK
jgi:ubiquinone/menaquinone biosynthesis C-methylase UbiE